MIHKTTIFFLYMRTNTMACFFASSECDNSSNCIIIARLNIMVLQDHYRKHFQVHYNMSYFVRWQEIRILI